MKAAKYLDGQLVCLLADALFTNDDMFWEITGSFPQSYQVSQPMSISTIKNPYWTQLYQGFESRNSLFTAMAGETIWGGASYVALMETQTQSIKWLLHHSKLNNPIHLKIHNNHVLLKTDLIYPDGLNISIPIENPESFTIENA